MNYSELHRHYPSALYAYFRIANQRDAMREFLEDPTVNPQFTYPSLLSLKYVAERMEKLQAHLEKSDDPAEKKFLKQRSAETQALKAFLELRAASGTDRKPAATAYRAMMRKLYGELSEEYFNGAMTSVMNIALRKHADADVRRIRERSTLR